MVVVVVVVIVAGFCACRLKYDCNEFLVFFQELPVMLELFRVVQYSSMVIGSSAFLQDTQQVSTRSPTVFFAKIVVNMT